MAQGEVLKQPNGTQGRTSFGPRHVERYAAGSMAADCFFVEQLVLNGDDLPTDVDFDDDTRTTLPAGSMITEVCAYCSSADSVFLVSSDEFGGVGNMPAIEGIVGTWVNVRDIDMMIGHRSQLTAGGLAAGETMTVLIKGIKPVVGDNGVLHRVS